MRSLVLLLVLGLATTAAAQPRPENDRVKAAAHFKQGQAFFKTQQYDRALAEYQAALDLSGEPLMIFNIALTHDRAGRPEEALTAFQRYLELAPDGEGADEARDDVARLTPIVDKIRAQRAAADAQAAEAAKRAEAAQRAEAAKQAEAKRLEGRRAANAHRAASLDRRAGRMRWIAIGTGAVGLVSLGVGIKFGLDARSAADFISNHHGIWTDEVLERDQAGQRAETRMIVFTAIGGAAVVGAGVLYLVSRSSHRSAERLRVEVVPTRTGGAVALSGTF